MNKNLSKSKLIKKIERKRKNTSGSSRNSNKYMIIYNNKISRGGNRRNTGIVDEEKSRDQKEKH